jgi:glycosyltransferase involved in cell wall biosynthesis
VSAVLSNYNSGRFLSEAIESVLSQSYPEVELLVVDDGSTDDSLAVLDRYQDRISSVRQPNRGVAAARNRGIAESRGELVAFLDADDVWLPEKLALQVDLLERSPGVGMVCCELRLVDSSGRSLGTTESDLTGSVLEELALLRGAGVPGAGSTALIRRDVLDRVGLFDEQLSTSADWDLCRRIACHSRIGIVREALVLYRQHDGSMHRKVDVFERDVLRCFGKMFSDPAAGAVHPLRRRCYGNLHYTLAGSHLHAGNLGKCLLHLARSLLFRPAGIGRILSAPLRGAP